MPQFLGDLQGVDAVRLPPDTSVAMTVKLPVVNGAEWHGELIRDLPPQCCGLGKLEVVRVGPVAAADQARQVL